MDFELTPEEKAYQKELCEFLKREANEGVIAETESMQGLGPYGRELLRKMGQRRLLAPSWPQEYGGRGLTYVAQAIMGDEMSYHRGPWPLDGIVIGPTLLRLGTDSQKEKYLTGIARGEIEFALGYTEPEAGSDVASVLLRAVEDGDEYILNGQKVFNTEAHYGDYHWLLVRTDTSVAKHKGLSMFIVDLKSPGITIRPLITSAGLRTNEVFYEDVRVPKENIVGEKNRGWDVAMSALGSERVMWTGDIKWGFDKLVEYILEDKRFDDICAQNPWILDELAELDIKIHIGRLLGYKAASMGDKGLTAIYEGSLSKVYVTETRQQLFSVAMQILGLYGQLSKGSKWAPLSGMIPREYLDSCRWNIVGGTSEIQRLIIALMGLELPRK
ncbi:MAG: acyl-CoA dehydrogenase family protein [Desulfobacterales bacterium]|nr:acyl-CoA dehydrogenase family protein [Desulfobacterales bacterium]